MNKYLVCCGIIMLAINSIDISYASRHKTNKTIQHDKTKNKTSTINSVSKTSMQDKDIEKKIDDLIHGKKPTIDNFIKFLKDAQNRNIPVVKAALYCAKVWGDNRVGGNVFLKQLVASKNAQKIRRATGLEVFMNGTKLTFSYTSMSVGQHQQESSTIEKQNSSSETNGNDIHQNDYIDANKTGIPQSRILETSHDNQKVDPADPNIFENFNKIMDELKMLRIQVNGLQDTVNSKLRCDIAGGSELINNYSTSTTSNIAKSSNISVAGNSTHISESSSDSNIAATDRQKNVASGADIINAKHEQMSKTESDNIDDRSSDAIKMEDIKDILIKKYPITFGEFTGQLDVNKLLSLGYNDILSNSYLKEHCSDVIYGLDKPIYNLQLPDDITLEPYLKKICPKFFADVECENYLKERAKHQKAQLEDGSPIKAYELRRIWGHMEAAKNEQLRRYIEVQKIRLSSKVKTTLKENKYEKNAEYKKHDSSKRNDLKSN